MNKRNTTRPVRVGDVQIGGQDKVVIQTMTVSKTADVDATVAEIRRYASQGAELVRVAVVDEADAAAIREIKSATEIPVIADVHYDLNLALLAVSFGADKIRVNPGTLRRDADISRLVEVCSSRDVPIRIGINAGSLERDVEHLYGRSARAMIESARRIVSAFEAREFRNLVLSFKASSVALTTETNLKAAEVFGYPLHIGVTESGPPREGIVKSAAALGTLLYHGIGDTIRISLSGDRGEELLACKRLLAAYGLYRRHELISCPSCGRIAYDMSALISKVETHLDEHPSTLKIAIMGCTVNGPGEARDADIGIAGGKSGALLFKKGEPLRTVPFEDMFAALVEAIEDADRQTD